MIDGSRFARRVQGGAALDYDGIAPTYDRRYAANDYSGITATLRDFAFDGSRVLEVGCGTGHWLEVMRGWGCRVGGLDPSAQMLARATQRNPAAMLVRGRAEWLPWKAACFDRRPAQEGRRTVSSESR
jgi:ubiquinone/menaquinone biosynthesis C-methylase UbiE